MLHARVEPGEAVPRPWIFGWLCLTITPSSQSRGTGDTEWYGERVGPCPPVLDCTRLLSGGFPITDELSAVLEGQPERLATGFAFTEGPVWHPDGFLYFVDVWSSRLLRWAPGGDVEVARENTGEGAGLTFDLQGRLIMCEGANRRVTRTEHDGTVTVLADRWLGKRLNRPNDVVGRSDGSIYFSDPGGRVPPEERELDFSGVYRLSPDGQLHLATEECEYPNGLAFSLNESILYVAITRLDARCFGEKERHEVCTHQLIRAFDVAADGGLSNKRVFADMSSAEEGVPDGMRLDTEGKIFFALAQGEHGYSTAPVATWGPSLLPRYPPTAPSVAQTTGPCLSLPGPRFTAFR